MEAQFKPEHISFQGTNSKNNTSRVKERWHDIKEIT